MSRAVVEVRGREGGDRKSTHDPRTVPEVVIPTAQTRCQSIPHKDPDCNEGPRKVWDLDHCREPRC